MEEKRTYSERIAALQIIVIAPLIIALSWWIRIELESFVVYPLSFFISTIPIVLYLAFVRWGYQKFLTKANPQSGWVVIIEGVSSVIIGLLFFIFFIFMPITEILSSQRALLWIIFGVAWLFTGTLEILVGFVIRYEREKITVVVPE